MRKQQKFFICRHCGNIIGFVTDAGVPVVCCGQKMEELIPNTTEAATEKHLPAVTVKEGLLEVQVGTTLHPATEEHHIVWIYVETEKGGQRKTIEVGQPPKANFALVEDKPLAVFAYCNLHGLWKTTL